MTHIQTIENFHLWAQSAKTKEALVKIFVAALREYGFEGMSVATYTQAGLIVPELTDYENEPIGWIERYFEKNYGAIDPVVMLGKTVKKPFLWAEAIKLIKLTESQNSFLKEAEYMAGTGLTLPVKEANGRRSVVNLYTSESFTDIKPYANYAHLLGLYFHSYYRKLSSIDNINNSQQNDYSELHFLSDEEISILYWTTHGINIYEIADILSLSTNQTYHFTQSAIDKLSSLNIDQASQRAFQLGLIDIK